MRGMPDRLALPEKENLRRFVGNPGNLGHKIGDRTILDYQELVGTHLGMSAEETRKILKGPGGNSAAG